MQRRRTAPREASPDDVASRAGERGLTLIELLVTMAILGVVMGAVTVVFNSLQQTTRFSQEELQAQQIARTSIDQMANRVRQAVYPTGRDVMLDVAEPDRIVFYGQFDDDAEPERGRYDLDGDDLRGWFTEPVSCGSVCTYPSWNDVTSRVVVDNVRNQELDAGACQELGGDESIFTYYRRASAGELVEIPEDQLLPYRPDIAAVEVTIVADLRPEAAPECRRLNTLVHLRNWNG